MFIFFKNSHVVLECSRHVDFPSLLILGYHILWFMTWISFVSWSMGQPHKNYLFVSVCLYVYVYVYSV